METLLKHIDERGVATITLNRPEKHHAFNRQMIDEMTSAMGELAGDESVRAVVLASSGSSFCGGGDLNWMRQQVESNRRGKIAEATALAEMLKSIYLLPKPVICRVQGNAFGGGLGLMAAADITIARAGAKFALTETRLGLIPATIAPIVLARIGSGAARSVFITGSVMTTERAKQLGLVSIMVEEDGLDEAVEGEVQSALASAPQAMARAKALAIKLTAPELNAQFDDAIKALAECWESEEAQRGIKAFLDKTPTPWVKG